MNRITKSIIILFFLLVVYSSIVSFFLSNFDKFINPIYTIKEIYWSSIPYYQFSKEHNIQNNSTIFLLYNSIYNSITNAVFDFSANKCKKIYFVDCHGFIEKSMDKNLNNRVVKLNNGYLSFYKKQRYSDSILNSFIDNLFELETLTKTLNIQLIYIQFPSKIHKYDSQLPIGLRDFTNAERDRFLQLLYKRANNEEKSIKIYDCRELLLNNSREHYRMFYRGDHHWKPEYAFYCFQDMINKNYFENQLIVSEDICEINNYHITHFPMPTKDGIGSQERQTGKIYFNNSDFGSIFSPNYSTCFQVNAINYMEQQFTAVGDFNHTLQLKEDESLRTVENSNVKKGSVLLIKDSFGLPYFSYLCLIAHKSYMIDLRCYRGSVYEFIKKHKPDIVIVGVSELEKVFFNFEKNDKE